MGEYAVLISALSVAFHGLGGPPAKPAALPGTLAQARVVIAKDARAVDVSASGAREALEKAPYRRAALRYLYARGWIAGAKSPAACQLARLADGTAERAAADGLRRDRRALEALRRAKITVATAARTLVRGLTSACA